ncbi:MAG: dihydroorotase [Candidatus Brocadiales bacterium]
MTSKVLIKNGRVIDPSTSLDEQLDVLVADGNIAEVRADIKPQGEVEIVDAPGCIVTPGLIDCHVHLRESGREGAKYTGEIGQAKETIGSGSRAAAKGGFTTILCEPNTTPPIDSCMRVDELQKRITHTSLVETYLKASMTLDMQGERITDIKKLSGHPLVKALSEDGNPIVEDKLMGEVCRLAAENNLPLSCHCEDSSFSLTKRSKKLGFRPREDFHNEPNFITRDILLAEANHAQIHISHVSMKESLEIIRRAKTRSRALVTCEVTPHHLLLEDSFRDPSGSRVIVNPPLRSKEDREALLEALKEGIIDLIASDHAPHGEEDKKAGAPGLIGLETTLGLVLTRLVRPGIISLTRAIRMMSTSPATTFRLEGGSFKKGARADITIIDPGREWTVDTGKFESLSRNCPFEGWRLQGQAVAATVGGRIVMRDGELIQCI